jgi:signal transduction histidine kinase
MLMHLPSKFSGLSARLYAAFLAAAVLPVAIAGLVGIHYSIQALREETLSHLDQEVASRAETVTRFMEQLASELLYLSASPALDNLVEHPNETSREKLERDFSVFATAYPYIYQLRYLDAAGHEVVRVDRMDHTVHPVPLAELQDKSDRYYFREAMALPAGRIFVSPLDLNIERGQVESPERPVIRVATPVADAAGTPRGLLIINLHAELFLRQVQQMAEVHGGTAYLFDRAGYYIAQSGQTTLPQMFRMRAVASSAPPLPAAPLVEILGGKRGVAVSEGLVVAYAPVEVRTVAGHQGTPPRAWSLALAYPQSRFFSAVFNLYLLYAVLVVALAATAIVGWLVSRRLLRRLVDERREQDRQLFQREKMNTLGELSMGLAHEIGNPLAGMKAVVQVLQQDDAPDGSSGATMRKYLPKLENEIDRLSSFLRTFNGFAAPQAHHPIPCRLEDVLDDVLLWTRKEAREKGIEIQYRRCGKDIPPLLADPNQLKQLLLNLVINAIHAIDGPGRITLSMCNSPLGQPPAISQRRHIHFCVEDDGPGIPAEALPKIFEPFFTTRPKGTGLGLAVVKKIADQHGATIQVHAGPGGRGSRFELAWPAAGMDAQQPDAEACVARPIMKDAP